MNPLKLYFRSLLKNKFFSYISIGSFSVSMAIIIILASFLVSEYSYDNQIPNINRIYRIKASLEMSSVPEQARSLILEKVPEVQSITNFLIYDEPVVYKGNEFRVRVINSDEGLFSVLPVKFITGTPEGIFSDKNQTVITAGTARMIFGDESPVGKILNVSHGQNVTVTAVISDFPEKSTLTGGLICSSDLKIRYSSSCRDSNCTYYYKTLLKLSPGASPGETGMKISSVIPPSFKDDKNSYSLIPYKNAYFDLSLPNDNLQHANIKLLQLLFWLTVVLLALAIFNYINLSVAQNSERMKEFGIKQILGVRGFSVFLQFIYEAVFTTLTASILAIFLAVLFQPFFLRLFGKSFSIPELFQSPRQILIMLMLLTGISVISALYPALLATRVRARDLIQRKWLTGTGSFDIRKFLNIIQFAATMAIIVSLMVITRQINFAKNMDYGFSTEQLIQIPVHWKARDKADVLMNRLCSVPGVKSVCYSAGIPGNIYSYSQSEGTGKVSQLSGDYRFTETFGLPVVEGRNFFPGEQGSVCLLNRNALKQLGWNTFEGKEIFGFKVIGLIDDFHYESLYNRIGALMISNEKDVSHVSVRILPGNVPATLDAVRKGFKEVLPDFGFSFSFYQDYFNAMYQQEEKRADSIRIIALVALFISCIGLIGLAEFSTKNRVKEIGIRKVNGARITEVMMLLDSHFMKWLIISFLIAVPVTFFIMRRWLETFAYKTSLDWWIFLLAGLLTISIALLSVSFQSWKAATRNPVDSLRYE